MASRITRLGRLAWFVALIFATCTSSAHGDVRVVVWDEQQPAQKEAYDNFIGRGLPSVPYVLRTPNRASPKKPWTPATC
jgi:hypothetical protein